MTVHTSKLDSMSATSASLIPARLHVLLARDSSKAVVIRRGPSKKVCTIGWNRDDDSFTVGQWLSGRIYERRSDLSPDGRHFIYFAMNGRWQSEVKGSWTAISRAPYLKAIGLWAKGDCWHGGGLFIDGKKYWINEGCGHQALQTPATLQAEIEYPGYVYYGGECTGVYYLRLMRDGWRYVGRQQEQKYHSIDIFEKRINDHWVLRKLAHATIDKQPGKGCYYDQHQILNVRTEETLECTAWEWAEIDGNRIVWAQNGKLFAARMGKRTLGAATELHDFNAMQYERIAAPY